MGNFEEDFGRGLIFSFNRTFIPKKVLTVVFKCGCVLSGESLLDMRYVETGEYCTVYIGKEGNLVDCKGFAYEPKHGNLAEFLRDENDRLKLGWN